MRKLYIIVGACVGLVLGSIGWGVAANHHADVQSNKATRCVIEQLLEHRFDNQSVHASEAKALNIPYNPPAQLLPPSQKAIEDLHRSLRRNCADFLPPDVLRELEN